MMVFDCGCKWRFIVGKKQVYGPIHTMGPLGSSGIHGLCYNRGSMMSRDVFARDFADCEYMFQVQERGPRG